MGEELPAASPCAPAGVPEAVDAAIMKAACAELATSGVPGRVMVANSADLGVHKADRRFWEILRKRLELDRLRHILLIDDFGVNEQKDDLYADLQEVEKRRQQTIALLKAVFPADVQDFFFTIKLDSPLSSPDQLMDEASRVIDRFLDRP